MPVQRERKIGVFGERLQTQPAGFIDRILTHSADRAGNDGDAIPAGVSAPVQIKTTGVFQSLTARDERAQVADLRVTRHSADARPITISVRTTTSAVATIMNAQRNSSMVW